MQALWVDLLVAQRNVWRQGRRSALALTVIATGVAALMLAGGFIEWNFWHYRETMIKSQLGHIQVHRAGYSERGRADPFQFLLPSDAPELRDISALRHVKVMAPRLALGGMASHGDVTLPFLADGFDPRIEADATESLNIVAGRALEPGDADGVMIGEGLARNLGVQIGDRVVLMANTETGSLNAIELTVRGSFATVSKAYDDIAVRLPLHRGQELLRTSGAHSWVLLLDRTDATPAVLAALRERLPQSRFEIIPWWTRSDFYNKSAALFEKQVLVMQFIIGCLIVLSISNTLMMSVMERTSEIGTAMALGLTRASVRRRFLAEGGALGILGAGLGLVAGAVLAHVISAIGIPVPPPPGMAHGYTSRILVTLDLAVGAMLLAFCTSFLASAYPAWKASRMIIVESLRQSRP